MRELIQPLRPVRDLRKGGGMRKYGERWLLGSVFHVLRSGCRWRLLPRDPMPWDAAHRWFTKWRGTGTALGSAFMGELHTHPRSRAFTPA
ncbi:transposase [Streptomyces sp. NPDC079020]|uniref:transposase n=1 Tax=Streptomyces sp. NPDC079020 TaxID=3365722 RepID=UPI0037D1DD7A